MLWNSLYKCRKFHYEQLSSMANTMGLNKVKSQYYSKLGLDFWIEISKVNFVWFISASQWFMFYDIELFISFMKINLIYKFLVIFLQKVIKILLKQIHLTITLISEPHLILKISSLAPQTFMNHGSWARWYSSCWPLRSSSTLTLNQN